MSGGGSSAATSDGGPSPFERKVTPQECDLALLLVRDKLGDAVAQVAKAVVDKGQSQLSEIISMTKMTPEAVKHCLIILIKHNFVRSYQLCKVLHANKRARRNAGASSATHNSEHKEPRRIFYFIYVADPNYMLSLLRFPKWMIKIKDTLSKEAEFNLEALVEHGRLNRKEVLRVANDRMSKQEKGERDETDMMVELESAFATLVEERYVERVPSVLLPPPWHRVLDTSVKRGHKVSVVCLAFLCRNVV